jgi:GNAT superfamily N-acetyltransferase
MSFRLRAATAEDLPAIAAVNVAAARAAWADIAPVSRMLPRVEEWAPRLSKAEVATVAVDADEVVGFAFTGGCELQYFFTHPRVWGLGAGRALLASAEEALREAGCASATLWTEERNRRALRVYAAAGWAPDGGVQEREWLGVPIRELRLGKWLSRGLRDAPRR